MRKQFNIDHLESIQEVYQYVDQNAFQLDQNRDLAEVWIKYRNKTQDSVEKEWAQYEIDCLSFDIKSGILFSQVYANHNGEVLKYPDIDHLAKSAIDYVIKRASDTGSVLLKARYNHILWKCPPGVKNNKYALVAVKSYIDSIRKHTVYFNSTGNENALIEISNLYENLLALQSEYGVDLDETKKLTHFLLFDNPDFKHYILRGFLEEMLKYPKLFKKSDFENTLIIFENRLHNIGDIADDFTLVNYDLPTAIRVARKLGQSTRKWHQEVGNAHLRKAEKEIDEDRLWIKHNQYAKAIEAFKLSGDDEARKEVEKRYTSLKPKVKLNKVQIPFDEEARTRLHQSFKYIEKVANSILELPSHEVYVEISKGQFFPGYKDVEEAVKNSANSFMNFAVGIYFDSNINVSQEPSEKKYSRQFFETYSFRFKFIVMPYLHSILYTGIASGKLTYKNLMIHLIKNTWMGKPNFKYDLDGNEHERTWISLLAPSLLEFFSQTRASVSSKYYQPSYVLSVDSLTLKIEGLFRDFCQRVNIPTSRNKQKGMQEINLSNILEDGLLEEYFNEDDLLFFNYVFSSEGGINLRNNVAHCFYDYDDYDLNQMLILIAVLLRIGKYDYSVEERQ